MNDLIKTNEIFKPGPGDTIFCEICQKPVDCVTIGKDTKLYEGRHGPEIFDTGGRYVKIECHGQEAYFHLYPSGKIVGWTT